MVEWLRRVLTGATLGAFVGLLLMMLIMFRADYLTLIPVWGLASLGGFMCALPEKELLQASALGIILGGMGGFWLAMAFNWHSLLAIGIGMAAGLLLVLLFAFILHDDDTRPRRRGNIYEW